MTRKKMRQQLKGKFTTKPAYTLECKVNWSIGVMVTCLTVYQALRVRFSYGPHINIKELCYKKQLTKTS